MDGKIYTSIYVLGSEVPRNLKFAMFLVLFHRSTREGRVLQFGYVLKSTFHDKFLITGPFST